MSTAPLLALLSLWYDGVSSLLELVVVSESELEGYLTEASRANETCFGWRLDLVSQSFEDRDDVLDTEPLRRLEVLAPSSSLSESREFNADPGFSSGSAISQC